MSALTGEDLTIAYHNCVETIGIGLALRAAVAAEVPEGYTLEGDPSSPLVPMVLKTAHCESVDVNATVTGETSFAQIGPVIVPPDGTGSVNLYHIWYYTSNKTLAEALRNAGARAEHSPDFVYNISGCAPGVTCAFRANPDPTAFPGWNLSGTIQQGTTGVPTDFVSNFWQKGRAHSGRIKIQTSAPAGALVAFGAANLVATTAPDSELAALFGTSTINFPIQQQVSTYPTGVAVVTNQ